MSLGAPVARLYGEPLLQLPQDLYIPPDALEIFLEAFEGPLDLLLYLIRKQNFNIMDIPMVALTEQYLHYVDQIRQHHLELAADYLLMAAMLIEIKSRYLLPAPHQAQAEEEGDPRAELVRRLLAYEKAKQGGQYLGDHPQIDRDFHTPQVEAPCQLAQALPSVHITDLQQAWQAIVQRAKLNQRHHISKEQLSVSAHMRLILHRLQDGQRMDFQKLFSERIDEGDPVAVLVVHFLALLELCREALIDISQAEPYAPIYVQLRHTTKELP